MFAHMGGGTEAPRRGPYLIRDRAYRKVIFPFMHTANLAHAAFMYLTVFRENRLQDVITKLEPDLFSTATRLTVHASHPLVRLKVFNSEQMNQEVFAFRRYEDAPAALYRPSQSRGSASLQSLRHGPGDWLMPVQVFQRVIYFRHSLSPFDSQLDIEV